MVASCLFQVTDCSLNIGMELPLKIHLDLQIALSLQSKCGGAAALVFFPDCEEVFLLEDLEVGWYGDRTWMESLMVSA